MIDYGKKEAHDGSISVLNIWQRAALKLVDFSGLRVLDVGCGSGSFLRFLETIAGQVLGVDPNPHNIAELTAHGIPGRVGYLHDFEVELAGQFDAVTCFEVVEHLYTPWEVFTGAYKVLADGGVFVVSTPNAFHLVRAFDFVFRQRHRDVLMDPTRTDIPEHVRLWSRDMLMRAFTKSRFREVRCLGTFAFHGKEYVVSHPFLVRTIAQNLICIGKK